jgi:hypothetical protein
VSETKSAQVGKFGSIAMYSDSSDEEMDSEISDEGEDNTACSRFREEEAEKETGTKRGVLTPIKQLKKEKGLKENELDNLDEILNEFGIDVQAPKEPNEEKLKDSVNDLVEDEEDKLGKKKKKKKKKKQSDAEIINEATATASISEVDTSSPPSTIDVAAVLKSKVPTKKKTTAEIAAANAAKEAKAKKEVETKKKKKKKDKFLHGAVQR